MRFHHPVGYTSLRETLKGRLFSWWVSFCDGITVHSEKRHIWSEIRQVDSETKSMGSENRWSNTWHAAPHARHTRYGCMCVCICVCVCVCITYMARCAPGIPGVCESVCVCVCVCMYQMYGTQIHGSVYVCVYVRVCITYMARCAPGIPGVCVCACVCVSVCVCLYVHDTP